MFLNDAFDAPLDARERPERPIPSGRAARGAVFALGFGQLALGLALLVLCAVLELVASGPLLPAAGAGTAAAVVLYDRFHKGFAWSPIVMGLCRAGLYALGAYAVSATLSVELGSGALALLLYVVGLTHVARFETASVVGRLWPAAFVFAPLVVALLRWPPANGLALPLATAALFVAWTLRGLSLARRGGRQIGRAVVTLIVGISLVDALLAAAHGAPFVSLFALGAALLTLVLQRSVRGT